VPDIVKSYIHKVYRAGTYLGVLQGVRSLFGFAHDINSAGSSITVDVALTFDTAPQTVGPILDETGDPILDENDDPIYPERVADVIGNSSDSILLRNGNVVDIWEYSNYHPNGKKMFSGVINKIEGEFAGEEFDEVVTITLYSRGSELDNYLIQDTI
jgi:hypothetical protein